MVVHVWTRVRVTSDEIVTYQFTRIGATVRSKIIAYRRKA